MRKSFKAVFAVLLVFIFSFAALAFSPEDALSARPAESVYSVVRVADLSGLLQSIFSPASIEMLASSARPEYAQTIRLIASLVSQIPAESVAIISGMTINEEPFLQIAASMPDSLRPQLNRVADGTASGIELITLLLGDGGLMLAAGFAPEVHEGAAGPYYTLEGQVAFAARDNLLLIGLSPAELAASIGALEDEGNRLSLRRRFDSPNFWFTHMDMHAIAAIAGETEEGGMDEVVRHFRAPLKMEIAFSSEPGSFLVSTAVNALESLADIARYEAWEPVEGANLFLAGGGRLLYALSSPLALNAADLAASPEISAMWNQLIRKLERVNISESDVEDLLNGSFSVVLGSDATIMGKRVPGGYLAFTGREGAAAQILGKLLDNEEFAQSVPMAPLEVDGWDSVFAVDPALLPVPLILGVMGDTLFVGVVDSAALPQTPEFSAEVAELLEKPLLGVGVIDNAAIWNWLRQEIADPGSLLSVSLVEYIDNSARELLQVILEAEPAVPFVKAWMPDMEKSFLEFSIVDVPVGQRLLPRLLDVFQALIR